MAISSCETKKSTLQILDEKKNTIIVFITYIDLFIILKLVLIFAIKFSSIVSHRAQNILQRCDNVVRTLYLHLATLSQRILKPSDNIVTTLPQHSEKISVNNRFNLPK